MTQVLTYLLASDRRTSAETLTWLATRAPAKGATALALATHPNLPATTTLNIRPTLSVDELHSALRHPALPAARRSEFIDATPTRHITALLRASFDLSTAELAALSRDRRPLGGMVPPAMGRTPERSAEQLRDAAAAMNTSDALELWAGAVSTTTDDAVATAAMDYASTLTLPAAWIFSLVTDNAHLSDDVRLTALLRCDPRWLDAHEGSHIVTLVRSAPDATVAAFLTKELPLEALQLLASNARSSTATITALLDHARAYFIRYSPGQRSAVDTLALRLALHPNIPASARQELTQHLGPSSGSTALLATLLARSADSTVLDVPYVVLAARRTRGPLADHVRALAVAAYRAHPGVQPTGSFARALLAMEPAFPGTLRQLLTTATAVIT